MPSMPTGLNISSNEEEFEIPCLKLLRLRWKRPRIQQHGKRGERQHAVDSAGNVLHPLPLELRGKR